MDEGRVEVLRAIADTVVPSLERSDDPDGFGLFTAHQLGTCPMGSDARTSVAGRYGELHDAPGVWIGDAGAFPTSSGTNPMITIMALARRTGEAIVAASPAATSMTA
jgi:choline dehydrogenase-like flavoprotein